MKWQGTTDTRPGPRACQLAVAHALPPFRGMLLHLPRPPRGRWSDTHHDPFDLLRRVVVVLLLAGTAVALVLWASGVAPRALTLAGLLWTASAAAAWFLGMAGPAVDALARVLQDVGLVRAAGFSEIEALLARGQTALAAERYAERADDPDDRVEATCRRAVLLAGPLSAPALAVAELELLRGRTLDPAEERRVGTLLADLHARALGDPGRAMAELRRLLDTHPAAPEAARWRRELAELKEGARY